MSGLIVAPISSAIRMAGIAIRFWNFAAISLHFSEARAAVFAVEQVEYGGHDRTPSFDHRAVPLTTSLGMQEVI